MSDEAETPILDLIATMTEASVEASSLDPQSLMVARIAALIAVDAPPASYVLNLGWPAMSDSTGTRCEVCSPPSPRSSGRLASPLRWSTSAARSDSQSSWPSWNSRRNSPRKRTSNSSWSVWSLTSDGEGGRDVSGTE